MKLLIIVYENIKEGRLQQTLLKDFSLYLKEAWLAYINIAVSNIYSGICTNLIFGIRIDRNSALKTVSGLRSQSRARLGKG